VEGKWEVEEGRREGLREKRMDREEEKGRGKGKG